MSLIPTSKFGDCSECGAKDTACVKLGKNLVCLSCRKSQKVKVQMQKASIRNKVRSLPHITEKERVDIDSRSNLLNDLDFYTSRIVRLMASDESGIAVCYCCGKKDKWQNMDNAHFISRSALSVRFDIKYNCRANCKTCNQYKDGNLKAYQEELIKEIGFEMVENLKERAREVWKPTNDELSGILSDYKSRLKILESKLKL